MCDFFTKEEVEARDVYYREERPSADREILKALFDTIPVIFPKEENRGWTGATKKYFKEADDNE